MRQKDRSNVLARNKLQRSLGRAIKSHETEVRGRSRACKTEKTRWGEPHGLPPLQPGGRFAYNKTYQALCFLLESLVRTLKAEYRIDAEHVVGHSDVKATACPGKYFPLDEVSFGLPASGFVQRTNRPGESTFADFNRN